MMLTSKRVVNVLATICVSNWIISLNAFEIDERIEVALDRVFDYLLVHHNKINLDGLFGVVLAEVHLEATLKKTLSTNGRKKVEELKKKANFLYDVIKEEINEKGDENEIIFLEEIVDPYLWHRDIIFQRGLVSPSPPPNITSPTKYQEYLSYVSKSNMSETQSDECILQLIASGSRKHLHDCHPSPKCRHQMIEDGRFDPNYGITHRLLYIQIGRNRLCTFNVDWYFQKVQNYCSYILWEAVKNANFGFLDILDDILLEQMTLCGYEGFTEFFSLEFVEHVLEVQTVDGCYGIPSLEEDTKRTTSRIARRSANIVANGCNDHTTGLGASTLALALRYYRN